MELGRIKSIIESLVLVSEEPLSKDRIKKCLPGVPTQEITSAIKELMQDYEEGKRGLFIAEVAGGFQFRTHPANADYIRILLQQKPQKLSRPAMETMVIIAYRQPIIKPDIDKIRGSDSAGVLNTLMQHKLIKILGRQNAPGKPFIYGTTKEFLEKFGLKDLAALPTLREIEEISEEDIQQTPIDMLEDAEGQIVPEGEAAQEAEANTGEESSESEEQPAADDETTNDESSEESLENESGQDK